jgi:hypothetical protein
MERCRSLLERYVERYNAGDLDGVRELYAEDSNLYYDNLAVATQLGLLPQQVSTTV